MNWFIHSLGALALLCCQPDSGAGPQDKKKQGAVFEVRRAEEENGKGLREVRVRGREKALFVPERPDLVAMDFSKCVVIEADEKIWLSLSFTKKGEEKLRNLTRGHNMKPLAFLLDGEVVSAPVVNRELPAEPGGGMIVAGRFSREEADRVARSINGP